MKEIKIFNHEMFGEIRTMTDERGETFFVGKDIAEALGYAKPQNALATHVDDDDKTTALIQGTGSNYKTKVVIINESGLYALVLSSKLQQAKAFKRWVTSEVLPQIRKTGAYVSQKKQIENLTRHIEELEPKAEYCDEVLESVSCFTTTQIAKELSMTVHDLTRLLEQRKVMYKQSGQWMLYADYARKGYAKSRTHTHYDAEGDLHTRTYLVWTEEGRRFIHWLCSDEEIVIPFLLSVTTTD
jgi:prophage antirepressor-like protein